MGKKFKCDHQNLMVGFWLKENANSVYGAMPSSVRNMLVEAGLISSETSTKVVAKIMKYLGLFVPQPRVGLKGLSDNSQYKLSVGFLAVQARGIQEVANSCGVSMAAFCRTAIISALTSDQGKDWVPVQRELPFGLQSSSRKMEGRR